MNGSAPASFPWISLAVEFHSGGEIDRLAEPDGRPTLPIQLRCVKSFAAARWPVSPHTRIR